MMQNLLIYVISPTHVIASLAAVKALHDNGNISVTMVVYWPGAAEEMIDELGDVVKKLTSEFPYIETVSTLSHAEFMHLVNPVGPLDSTSAVKEFIGKTDIHEIYYAHDVVGDLYQLLCSTYPDAKRICFGDALGIVYEREVHLSYLRAVNKELAIKQSVLGRIKQVVNQLFGTSLVPEQVPLKDYKPHKAALILPVDQSGNFLKNTPLTVISKNIASVVIGQCSESCRSLNDYLNTTVETYSNKCLYLLLTDNFSEGNFIDFDREIDMYCSTIRAHCEPGSVVFLKSHPGETLTRNQRIVDSMGADYTVVELDKRFKRYPIELWKELVQQTTVICLSYPVLSLKYLYDIDVVQPMDHAFIEQWFPEWTWRSYKNSLTLYMAPLKNLATWDGKSVLWSGNK
jgi:hypothetical protein